MGTTEDLSLALVPYILYPKQGKTHALQEDKKEYSLL